MSDVERVTLRRCPRIVRQTSSGKVSNEWQVPVPGDSDLCPACESAPFVPAAALDAAVRERDEARAGVDAAIAGWDDARARGKAVEAERDDARAEVERLRTALDSVAEGLALGDDPQVAITAIERALDDLPAGNQFWR